MIFTVEYSSLVYITSNPHFKNKFNEGLQVPILSYSSSMSNFFAKSIKNINALFP